MIGGAGSGSTTLGVILKASTAGFSQAMKSAERDVESFGDTTTRAADTTGRASQVIKAAWAVVATAVIAAVGSLIMESARFEESMRNVNSIAGMSDKALASTSDQILDMSTRFRTGAVDLADGMYDIQSSGFSGGEAMQVLEASATAATAGLTDTATASRVIAASLNAYGLEAAAAAHVSNVLFEGVNLGVMSFEEMAQSLTTAIPAAAAAKVPIEDLTAAVAAMTLTGLNAAEASTSVSRLTQGLIQPSEALAAAYKQLGYESGSQALATDGLAGVMAKLQTVSNGNIDTLLAWFPEIRAARGALSLMADEGQQYIKVQEGIAAADENGGAAAAAMAEQMKATTAQVALFVNEIKAGAIRGITLLLPVVTAGIAGIRELGGAVITVAQDVASRLEPAWEAMRTAFSSLRSVAVQLWEAAEPIAVVFGSIVAGTIITGVNVLASALEKVSGFLEEHPGLVRVIGMALATYAVAKTIAWAAEMAKTSSTLASLVGGAKNLGSAISSGMGTARAATGLVAEGFSGAFKAAGGGVAGLKAGIGGASSAMGQLGSMAPMAINPIGIAVTAATAIVVGMALAWKDVKDAEKAAQRGAEEFGDVVDRRLNDAATNAADLKAAFSTITADDQTELGKILNTEEYKKAMDELGITFEELSAAMARPGSEGEVMFAQLAAKAEDFDSVMESFGGSQDLSDGLQRLEAIGTRNLEALTRAGGPVGDRVKEIVDAQEEAALSAGEWATEYEKLGDAGDESSQKRIKQLKDEGDLVKVVKAESGDYLIKRNRDVADSTAVYARVLEQLEKEGIALDENGQARMKLNEQTAQMLTQTGVAEERYRAMTAAQQQQLAVLAELEPIAESVTEKLSGAGFGAAETWEGLTAGMQAALPIMRDGSVSAAELAGFQQQIGVSAEQAGARITLLAELTGRAAQELTAQFPTLGAAAQGMTIPVQQLDGSIQQVQMTADNFSLQKLLDEQQRLAEAQLAANENMTKLLNEGQAAIVQQAQSLPPELRGVFLQQVMEMPADQRAKLNADFLSQQRELADSGARLVEAGYGTIDLVSPTVASAVAARQGAVDEMGRPIDVPVTMDADTAAAEQELNDAARDRTSNVTQTVTRTYADIPGGAQAFHYGRYGMVTSYASGGVHPASGMLGPHLARDGADIIRYAEPGTGGEAFIPRNVSRARALPILNVAAGWHGARVVEMARGGLRLAGPVAPMTMNGPAPAAAQTSISVSFAPLVTVGGSVDGRRAGRELVAELRSVLPELTRMLRQEEAGRR